eukprot:PhF_6_TR10248/c0_g1_i1/m.15891
MSEKKSTTSSTSWLAKVHHAQYSRLTPAQREELLQKAHQVQSCSKVHTKAKSVELRSAGYKKSAMTAMSAITKTEAMPPRVGQPHVSAQALSEACVAHMHEQEEMYSEAQLLHAPMPQRVAPVMIDAITVEEETEGLEGLKKEPKSDEAIAAKFQVYETFSEKVTQTRTDLCKTVEEALPLLPTTAVSTIQKDMKLLDSNDNMGIHDQSRFWFVYDMMVKAGKNCTLMENLSRGIQAKVNLAADNSQPECPICLEAWSADVQPMLLGCCHRVCGTCWTEWQRVQGTNAFCPLCRNKEFLDAVMQRCQEEGLA